MEKDNNLKHIQDALNALPDDFSILEEQIDVELQMAYFEMAKSERPVVLSKEELEVAIKTLFEGEIELEEKKHLLVKLAGQDNIEAFRAIESFRKEADDTIRDWAVLALQESRMVIQSSLLGEQQVFISTGLGGKGQNIRYFVAMQHAEADTAFNETQRKLIESEFGFFLNKSEGTLEEINFHEGFALAVFLFPLKEKLHLIFKSFIDECNQYGNFLSEDVIITNVKKLTIEEVKEFIKKNE